MKRRNKLVFIVLLLAFLASGACNQNKLIQQELLTKNEKTSSVTIAAKKTEIEYAQWSVASSDVVKQKIDHYNETNEDNIHINLVDIPLDRYIETLNLLNTSGECPDVYEIPQEWLNSYIIKEWVADISKYLDEEFCEGFPYWVKDVSKRGISTNEEIYSVPSSLVTYRLIYNKDLFEEAGLNPNKPPKTMSELQKYARQISENETGNRKYGLAMPMGEYWVDFVQPMEALCCYSGVYFYDFKNGAYDLNVYQPWIEAIRILNEDGGIFPGMETMKSDLAMTQFAEGNIGMMFVSSWEISLLINNSSTKCNWAVAMPPTIDDSGISKGKIKIDTVGWNVINADTEQMDAAVKVWKYLYSEDYLGDLFSDCSAIPIKESYKSDKDVASDLFNDFLPGKNDSFYPLTPLTMEEWARGKVYLSVITSNQKDQMLPEESNRLNMLLNVSTSQRYIEYKDFHFPYFTPMDPMDN